MTAQGRCMGKCTCRAGLASWSEAVDIERIYANKYNTKTGVHDAIPHPIPVPPAPTCSSRGFVTGRKYASGTPLANFFVSTWHADGIQ